MSQTRCNGGLVTKISGERNHADSRIGLGDLGEKRGASILAAIVDIDDLKIEILVTAQHLSNPCVGETDHFLFVQEGNDDG